ncbi:alkaline phosphatase [Emydomyces testavorans]|uniref:Alkaline phosphatase n=1 Tax=Emydomyces testavorans TaxID=2070801 RepID=A0AAF0IFT1_9EURO|nr:alkaline phosphatase [Emydomyces testavorans]
MPTYRVEEASTGRAGCKNKECQEKKKKILKGELRMGSWVDTEQFQSWAWKHWGCVTPRQIASLQEIVGEDKDFSLVDGFDELSAANQDKIREAVEQGHVADSDWKGDVEMNRPGKTGFRVRASKKHADEDDREAIEGTPKKTKRPRGKKRDRESDAEEAAEPVTKNAKTAASKKKKKAAEAEAEEEEQEPDASNEPAEPPKARRKSGGKGKNSEAEQKGSKAIEPKRSRKTAEKAEPKKTTRVTRSKAK